MFDPAHNVSREQWTVAYSYLETYYASRVPGAYEESNEDGLHMCRSFLFVLQHAGELVLVFRPDIDTPTETATKKLVAHALENVAGVYSEHLLAGRYDSIPEDWLRCRWTCEIC